MEEIKQLLNKMTIREKVGQCVMIEPVFLLNKLNKEGQKYSSIKDPLFLDMLLNEYHIGFIFFGGATRIGDDTFDAWKDAIESIKTYHQNTGSNVPLFFGSDAVHGVNFIKGTTIFPHNLSVASTYNKDLAETYGNIVSKELHNLGVNINFAPTIDVARDQRWGRVYETLGEDPYLTTEIGNQMIKGIEKDQTVGASAKHFVGYGQSNNGMDRSSADISERDLREVHIAPFKKAIKQNVKTIMVNGSDVNGIPVPASKYLLDTVLRKELGFKGITLSDWEDIERLYKNHQIVSSKREAIKRAFNAGLDINMANTDIEAVDILEDLVNKNEITIDKLNETVKRILETKYALGLFEQNTETTNLKSIQQKTKQVAKQIAEESITLLKNKDTILPIKNNIKNILVTGETAHTKRHICGGWTLNWASANEEDLNFKTILEVLKEETNNINITYAKDLESLNKILNTNPSFDLCIDVIGEEPHSEWLGDTEDLQIETKEASLLEASLKLSTKHILVSLMGRPMDISKYEPELDAILWAYLPGSEGTKPIVDILLGNISPSGKTPITYPLHVGQIPIYYNPRRYKTETSETNYQPLYPFGYGLSYTRFKYSDLKLKKDNLLTATITITNNGNMKAKESVLLYVIDGCSSVSRPVSSLKGFEKVELAPGESKTITFTLTKDDLSYYDEALKFVFEPRTITVKIGNLKQSIKL